MKLYAVSDGPPSLAVRMALKALDISYELVNVDFIASEHMTEQYASMNPQKEIPVLYDDGFYLPESIAILQYLCDKYSPESPLYPKDPKMAPIFFDYERTPMGLKKLHISLATFETYLKRSGTKYAAGNNLTIADFPLVTSTLCLEAINFSIDDYPMIKKWYKTFKTEYPELWAIGEAGMKEIAEFEKNPPDLSGMDHPIHPIRKKF